MECCGPNEDRPLLSSRRRKVKISFDSGTTKMLGLHHLSQQARSSPANVMVLVGYQDNGSAHGAAVLRGPFLLSSQPPYLPTCMLGDPSYDPQNGLHSSLDGQCPWRRRAGEVGPELWPSCIVVGRGGAPRLNANR